MKNDHELVTCPPSTCGKILTRGSLSRHRKYHCPGDVGQAPTVTRPDNRKRWTCPKCQKSVLFRDRRKHGARYDCAVAFPEDFGAPHPAGHGGDPAQASKDLAADATGVLDPGDCAP